jgi:hypothetical protein
MKRRQAVTIKMILQLCTLSVTASPKAIPDVQASNTCQCYLHEPRACILLGAARRHYCSSPSTDCAQPSHTRYWNLPPHVEMSMCCRFGMAQQRLSGSRMSSEPAFRSMFLMVRLVSLHRMQSRQWLVQVDSAHQQRTRRSTSATGLLLAQTAQAARAPA